MVHNTTHNEPAYPSLDRQGIYCEKCGTIFYVPREISRRIFDRECPICGDHTLYWITTEWIQRCTDYNVKRIES